MELSSVGVLDVHTHKTSPSTDCICNFPLFSKSRSLIEQITYPAEGFYSVGIHPMELDINSMDDQLNLLNSFLSLPQTVALGEVGVDKLVDIPLSIQMDALCRQVALAEHYSLPLILHCVRAMQELLEVKRFCSSTQPWVWHGFRGKREQALQLLNHGFYLSFGLYYADEALCVVPDERLLIETDDSPVDIESILSRMAHLRKTDVDALRITIQTNVQNLFFKP